MSATANSSFESMTVDGNEATGCFKLQLEVVSDEELPVELLSGRLLPAQEWYSVAETMCGSKNVEESANTVWFDGAGCGPSIRCAHCFAQGGCGL